MTSPRPIKVLAIVGTRPEAIKMAPVVIELRRHAPAIAPVLCASGQHRELLAQALSLFELTPDHDLDVMRPNQELAALTSRLFEAIDRVLVAEAPDWVLVQGDTTTAMVGALAAFYRRVRVGHVEAGLRTGDVSRPFPEELNRRVADACATICFAPTPWARGNLLAEGRPVDTIAVTGNTVVDAVLDVARRPFDAATSPLADVPVAPRWVLVTTHRRESFGAPLERICDAVRRLAEAHAQDLHFIVPVHPNPHVSNEVRRRLDRPNCSVVEPLDYRSLVAVLARAALVLTDSGGIQEEAPTFGVPVLVLREKTERPEAVAAGVCTLVGTDPDLIVRTAEERLSVNAVRPRSASPYGDGRASRRIVARLRRESGLPPRASSVAHASEVDGPDEDVNDWRPS